VEGDLLGLEPEPLLLAAPPAALCVLAADEHVQVSIFSLVNWRKVENVSIGCYSIGTVCVCSIFLRQFAIKKKIIIINNCSVRNVRFWHFAKNFCTIPDE
jgi:hypothetical protein